MNGNFEIGNISAEWKNNLDGYKVDYSDLHGFSLFAFLQSPSDEEIEKMSMNADLVIYFGDQDGVGFFVFNFSGSGGSAAFAPSLLLDYPKFQVPIPLNRFPFNIYVIDSSMGELKVARTVSLSDDFSEWLSEWCIENSKLDLTLDSVKAVSQKYFESFKQHDLEHSLRIAFNSSDKCIEHVRDSLGK